MISKSSNNCRTVTVYVTLPYEIETYENVQFVQKRSRCIRKRTENVPETATTQNMKIRVSMHFLYASGHFLDVLDVFARFLYVLL